MLPNEMEEWIKPRSKKTPSVILIIIQRTTIESDLMIFAKKIFISGSIAVEFYFKSSALNAVESPLNTLKSTAAAIPFTLPLSLCCQKSQLRVTLG